MRENRTQYNSLNTTILKLLCNADNLKKKFLQMSKHLIEKLYPHFFLSPCCASLSCFLLMLSNVPPLWISLPCRKFASRLDSREILALSQGANISGIRKEFNKNLGVKCENVSNFEVSNFKVILELPFTVQKNIFLYVHKQTFQLNFCVGAPVCMSPASICIG